MKILADQNIPYSSVKALKGAGINTKHVDKDLAGITDKEMLDIAKEEDRMILTFDTDFARLAARYGRLPRAGIVALDITIFDNVYPGKLMVKLLMATDIKFRKRFTIVGNDFVRQTKYA